MNGAAMPVSRSQRWWLWLALLGGAGGLAFFGDKAPAGSAAPGLPTDAKAQRAPVGGTAAAAHAATAPRAGAALALHPRSLLYADGAEGEARAEASRRDLFSTRNWNPPAPPAEAAPIAAPVAPPLPFTFAGKKLEGERWEVYLARGEQAFIAREGDVLEDHWRVDRIAPPALSFTYLPLGEPQTLLVGNSQ